jgi:hypothetical protein
MINETKKPWFKKWWAIIFLIIFVIIVIAQLKKNSNNANTIKPSLSEENFVTIFDFEALYGKNVDEIKSILGTPSSDTEPTDEQKQFVKEWEKFWQIDGYELLVTYNITSRRIVDYFVPTNDLSGATKDLRKLEALVGAKNLVNFTVLPVKALKDPTKYTGIRVIPRR